MLAPPHPRRQCCRGKPWEAYDSFMLHLTLTQHCRWGVGCIFNRSLKAGLEGAIALESAKAPVWADLADASPPVHSITW